jgi:hypothetical protein
MAEPTKTEPRRQPLCKSSFGTLWAVCFRKVLMNVVALFVILAALDAVIFILSKGYQYFQNGEGFMNGALTVGALDVTICWVVIIAIAVTLSQRLFLEMTPLGYSRSQVAGAIMLALGGGCLLLTVVFFLYLGAGVVLTMLSTQSESTLWTPQVPEVRFLLYLALGTFWGLLFAAAVGLVSSLGLIRHSRIKFIAILVFCLAIMFALLYVDRHSFGSFSLSEYTFSASVDASDIGALLIIIASPLIYWLDTRRVPLEL